MTANTSKKITDLTLVSNSASIANTDLIVMVIDPNGANVETVAISVNTFLQMIQTKLGL